MEFEHLRPVIIAALLRFGKGRVRTDDLEDLEQEVLLRLVRATQSPTAAYNPARGALTTYVYLVTRSVLYNAFAKNSRDPSNHALRLEVTATGAPLAIAAENICSLRDDRIETRLAAADVLAKLRAVADATSDNARLLARYVETCEQLTGEATEYRVARAMGVPVRLVQQVRQQARALLATLGAA
jgi:DNA-directed RNA polymerase specialized sigma24 family protein